MLELKGISKSWGEFKLRNVNLKIYDGEYFVILGPTGAGKTLLLETIAGLHKPDEGEIWFEGRNITLTPPEHRKIGIVFQDYALFPHMTVRENILFGLRLKKIPRREAEKRLHSMASMLKIEGILHRYPRTLSGGEKQRVALARALVLQPRLLLLDEPLSALDEEIRRSLWDELRNIHEKLGITTIHVTHDQTEAVALADRIGVMNQGSIVQVGTPQEVFRNPRTEFIARFTGFENIYEGHASESGGITMVKVEDVEIASTDTKRGKVKVCIRPEDITLYHERPDSSARNVFQGVISNVSDRGPLVRLKVRSKLEFIVLISKKSFVEMRLKTGSPVYLSFKASSVRLI